VIDSINTYKWATIRYHSNGSIDSSYGTNSVSQDFPINMNVRSVAIQSDGKYLVLGGQDNAGAQGKGILCRINNAGISAVPHVTTSHSFLSLHPTPSLDNCTLTYTLPSNSQCTIALCDESGKKVRVFAQDEYRTVGEHKDELDLRGLAVGVYFLSIEHDVKTETAKLIKQ